MGHYARLKQENAELNRREREAVQSRLESRPLLFWFDLFGECSLTCLHCNVHTYGRSSDREVSDHVYDTVMNEIMPTAYICNLGGTNYGEMTIAKSFPRFLEDCSKYEVRLNLTTNGTCINERWLDQLIDRAAIIGFSMEGMHEQFEMIRGFPWARFVANIEKVANARQRLGANTQLEWRYCAHAENIHQLPEMIRSARKIGIDRIQMMNLVPSQPAQKYKQLSYHRTLANRYFTEARQLAGELGVQVNVPPDFETGTWQVTNSVVQMKLHGKAISEPMAQSTSCGSAKGCGSSKASATPDPVLSACHLPWQACSINELGAVRPCCTYWRSVGSIGTGGFEAAWNSATYRRLRRNVNAQSNPICTACRMPRFDSERSTAALKLTPALRETVQAMRDRLTRRRRNVITVEKPIEVKLAHYGEGPASSERAAA